MVLFGGFFGPFGPPGVGSVGLSSLYGFQNGSSRGGNLSGIVNGSVFGLSGAMTADGLMVLAQLALTVGLYKTVPVATFITRSD